MDYENRTLIQGDPIKVLEAALNILVAMGFSIVKKEKYLLELSDPGLHSSKQNPILGASKIIVSINGNELVVQAEYGGIRKLMKFITILIVVMAISFLIFFTFLFGKQSDNIVYISLAPFLPWIVLLPLMSNIFQKRIKKSLDTFVNNVLVVGSST
jgi:hypothetical protein